MLAVHADQSNQKCSEDPYFDYFAFAFQTILATADRFDIRSA